MNRVEVAVIGGGIAGLACASELVRLGVECELFEAADRVGGPAESARIGEYTLDLGPSTVRGTPAIRDLIARAGQTTVVARAGARYVVHDGALLAVPPTFSTLLRGSWIPVGALAGTLAEPFRTVHAGPMSVHDFVSERLGPVVADYVADVMTIGVYGMSARDIGFESAFPALADGIAGAGGRISGWALSRLLSSGEPVQRSVAPPEGIGSLPTALAQTLGERINLGSPVDGLARVGDGFEFRAQNESWRSKHAVVALPAPAAARAISIESLDTAFDDYRSTPQTLAHFALDDAEAAARWSGFGFLVPSREKFPVLGTLFPSNIFPGRAPEGHLLASVFCGSELRAESDATIAATAGELLRRLLMCSGKPELLRVARYSEGIPVYDVHHRERTRELKRRVASVPGLSVIGAAFDGVAFAAAAESGLRAARAIAASD